MGTYVKLLERYEKPVKKEGLTITVSGLSGTGKTSFAKRVAESCGLKYMSAGEIFRGLAREKGMTIEEFCKIRGREVDLMVERKLLELAQKGGYVLDGRMAGVVAGDCGEERVLMRTKEELVARRVSEREKKTKEQALKDLRVRDEADTEKYLEVYGINPERAGIYTKIIENNGTYGELMEKANLFSKSCLEKAKK
jgi:cytidylate kinase